MATLLKQVQGDCDCCDNVAVLITMRHNMKMCDECIKKEDAVVPTIQSANELIAAANKADERIQVKQELFNAVGVAAIEMMAAIQNDETIPDDQKNYVMALQAKTRFEHMQKLVFETRQTLLAQENEMRAWQIQTQEFAGKLRTELRAQFKALDINYQPVTPKVAKPRATKAPTGKKPTPTEITAAANKYGVEANIVSMIINARKCSPDEAARIAADNK